MSGSQSVDVQAQIRRNADEQNSFLKDLTAWEKRIKKEDTDLKQKASVGGIIEIKADIASAALPSVTEPKPPKTTTPTELASKERQRGNNFFSEGQFNEAIKSYTRSLGIDPHSALAYSNRAMAYMKVKDWNRAESDATSALDIDPTHIKSYQRRSAARLSLGKLRAALKDLHLAEAMAASTIPGNHPWKGLAADMKRAEAALQAAVRRAPQRRVAVAILQEKEDAKEGKENEPKNDVSSTGDANQDQDGKVEDQVMMPSEHPSSTLDTLRSHANKANASFEKPSTWYQFEGIWKSLETQIRRSAFLASMKPRKVATLYKNGMDDVDLLVGIVAAAADTEEAADYLRCLAGIKSIDMTVMMMTAEHKALVRDAVRKSFSKEVAGGDAGEVAAKLGC